MESEKFKNLYRIPSARFKHWDYSDDGWYFVTICVRHHECAFGKIVNDKMVLNDVGNIVQQMWQEIPQHFENVQLDEFIVMPNHVHGIVVIENNRNKQQCRNAINKNSGCDVINQDLGRDAINRVSTSGGITGYKNPMLTQHSLGKIIRWFKGRATFGIHKYNSDFQWQPRFHDHIIRNDKSLQKIRKYIHFNVEKWQDALENPHNFL